ncbi:MAG: Rrf2 family transcriptional regulator [Novosphingobium sp.]|nr:Rrf2 family transcriptional regulator [Novosphingobium sp.]
MQLTRHTDYALRLLIYLCSTEEQYVAIAEVAEAQAISRTHLMKIANQLAHEGFIEAVRGRGGGIRLARDPGQINLAKVIAVTEPGCDLIDCTGCRLARRCKLPGILDEATLAFRQVLERYTLADLLKERRLAV